MKDIKFESIPHDRMWDQYRAFWKPLIGDPWRGAANPAVMFETGEVLFQSSITHVDYREEHQHLGITVFSTGDKLPFTLTTPEGEEVKRAWLMQSGQQILLADHRHKKVVRVDKRLNVDLNLPKNFQYGRAFYASTDAEPIGSGVELDRPIDYAARKAMSDWASEVEATAKAIYKIEGEDEGIRAKHGRIWLPHAEAKYKVSKSRIGEDVTAFVSSLDVRVFRQIAVAGIYLGREESVVPYLAIKE